MRPGLRRAGRSLCVSAGILGGPPASATGWESQYEFPYFHEFPNFHESQHGTRRTQGGRLCQTWNRPGGRPRSSPDRLPVLSGPGRGRQSLGAHGTPELSYGGWKDHPEVSDGKPYTRARLARGAGGSLPHRRIKKSRITQLGLTLTRTPERTPSPATHLHP